MNQCILNMCEFHLGGKKYIQYQMSKMGTESVPGLHVEAAACVVGSSVGVKQVLACVLSHKPLHMLPALSGSLILGLTGRWGC